MGDVDLTGGIGSEGQSGVPPDFFFFLVDGRPLK